MRSGLMQALFFKKRGEEAVQQSGMDYTIVRPGRLLDRLPPGQTQPGHILVTGSSPFTLPPFLSSAAILRSQVHASAQNLGDQAMWPCHMLRERLEESKTICSCFVMEDRLQAHAMGWPV